MEADDALSGSATDAIAKPCPFCGTAPVVSSGEFFTEVDCRNETCPVLACITVSSIDMIGARADYRIAAIARWNKRA